MPIRMRRRLTSPALKRNFQTAWSCIPGAVQKDFRSFIRQIREVDTLDETYIGCPDGTYFGPLEWGTGYTFFYKDESVAFCDVILPELLCVGTDAEIVCIILHELGHVYEYFIEHEKAIEGGHLDREFGAWDMAVEWAKNSALDPELIDEVETVAVDAKLQEGMLHLVESLAGRRLTLNESIDS